MVDDSTDAERCLRALEDFIAVAEAEVLRLSQLEREAEARLAQLRLTPPVLLWPEGVTLTVETPGRPAEPGVQPRPERGRLAETPRVAAPQAAPHPSPAASGQPAPNPAPAPTEETAVMPLAARQRPRNLVEAWS